MGSMVYSSLWGNAGFYIINRTSRMATADVLAAEERVNQLQPEVAQAFLLYPFMAQAMATFQESWETSKPS